MNTLQKIFSAILSSLLLAVALGVVISNLNVSTEFVFLQTSYGTYSLGLVLSIFGIIVGGSLFIKILELLSIMKLTSIRAERHIERSEVTSEISQDKVKALESKIETLEKALEKALEMKASPSSGKALGKAFDKSSDKTLETP
jgi:uncharacterized integral membrane protein